MMAHQERLRVPCTFSSAEALGLIKTIRVVGHATGETELMTTTLELGLPTLVKTIGLVVVMM